MAGAGAASGPRRGRLRNRSMAAAGSMRELRSKCRHGIRSNGYGDDDADRHKHSRSHHNRNRHEQLHGSH